MCPYDIHTFWLLITFCNTLKGLVTELNGKQKQCMHLLHESLVGKCGYPTQLKGSFWCHGIDTKGAVFY